jgi:hypothetical protein
VLEWKLKKKKQQNQMIFFFKSFFLPIGISYFREICLATVFRPLPVGPRIRIRGVRGAIERAFFDVNE